MGRTVASLQGSPVSQVNGGCLNHLAQGARSSSHLGDWGGKRHGFRWRRHTGDEANSCENSGRRWRSEIMCEGWKGKREHEVRLLTYSHWRGEENEAGK